MGTCIPFSPSSSSFFPSHLKLDDNNENGGQGMILIERTHLITISPHYSEAVLSRGYSPLLLFDVPDVDNTVVKLLRMGASLDGPIQYPDHGKVLFDSKLLITEACFPYIIFFMMCRRIQYYLEQKSCSLLSPCCFTNATFPMS